MISKKKIAVGLAGVASMLMVGASTFAATSASAATGGACAVNGQATVANGPQGATAAPGADTFTFNGVTITCKGTAPIDGTWTGVQATGSSIGHATPGETCAEAVGSGHFTGGANGSTTISGGNFTFQRAGALVHVSGSIVTSAGTDSFTSDLTFTPTAGGCFPGGSGDTVALMLGAAVITGP